MQFIRRNHDTDIITKTKVIEDQLPIGCKGYNLMPDPYRPPYYDGWIIYGDKHNLISHTYTSKTELNVCVEFTEYTPMSLDRMVASIVQTNL